MKKWTNAVLLCLIVLSCDGKGKSLGYSQIDDDELEEAAKIAYERDQYQKTVNLLTRLQNLKELTPDNKFTLADSYYMIKDYPKAIDAYQAVLEDSFSVGDVYFNLGLIYMEILDDSSSYNCFKKAYKLNPKDSIALGEMNFALRRIESNVYR